MVPAPLRFDLGARDNRAIRFIVPFAAGALMLVAVSTVAAAHLKAERAKWIKAIKDAGVTIQ